MSLQERFFKSEFIRSVAVLVSGTLAAQMVGYLVMPILTQIYTDVEFGEWGIYMRVVAFVSTVATARYELSLALPKHEGHSFVLYKLSLRIAKSVMILSVLLAVAYLLMRPSGWNDITFVIITLLSIFFVVYINLGTNWAIRIKAFNAISRQQVVNSLGANLFRLVFGFMGATSFGLIAGTLLGSAISSIWFIRDFLRLDRNKYKNYSKKKAKPLAKEYRDFPMVNLPHVTLDLGRDLLVAAFIVHFFGSDIFGQFNHSYLILKLPLALIGVAIGRVFYQRCVDVSNEGRSVYPLVRRTMFTLLLISIVPFTIIYLFGEPLFAFVFGDAWGKSGYYSEIMASWSMMLFVTSPLSGISLVLRRQKEFFLFGIIGSLIQVTGFGLVPLLMGKGNQDWINILWGISIAQTIYFFSACLFTLYMAKKGVKK